MRPAHQLKLHDPGKGIAGSCFSTCIAMILDLDPEDVPNFAESLLPYVDANAWLRERGFALVEVPGDLPLMKPGAAMIVTGVSPRNPGIRHAVVHYCDDNYDVRVFDPHPDGTGIDGDPTGAIILVPSGQTPPDVGRERVWLIPREALLRADEAPSKVDWKEIAEKAKDIEVVQVCDS